MVHIVNQIVTVSGANTPFRSDRVRYCALFFRLVFINQSVLIHYIDRLTLTISVDFYSN